MTCIDCKENSIKADQTTKAMLEKSAHISRFAYNWALAEQKKQYEKDKTFIQDGHLRKQMTILKKQGNHQWISDVSNDIPKQAIKDLCQAYKRFFKGQSELPVFKSRRYTKLSFYQDVSKLKVNGKAVYLSRIGWVKTSESLPDNTKFYNPRVSFDNKYWYLSVSFEEKLIDVELTDEVIGIDLGIKTLAVCSNGMTFKNINKSKSIKRKEKQLRRLQRQVSRKYQNNRKGGTVVKTCNIIKIENRIRKLNRRINGIRQNHIHQMTSTLVKTKPKRIVIEDLNIKGMMKNRHLSKAVAKQKFYEVRRQLEYKTRRYGIELVVADRFYPSSKMCNRCGHIDRQLSLKDRVYLCQCGYVNDRDLNASLNLKNYSIAV